MKSIVFNDIMSLVALHIITKINSQVRMDQPSNISMSISLVRKELEFSLQKAEGYFVLYAEDQEARNLKLFADELNLARGTFKLLQLNGPEALSTEMLSLIGDGALRIELKIDALGQAIISLGQYLNILLERERDYPVLLIPAINILRKTANHKVLPESHFFSVNLRPKLPAIDKATIDIRPHIPRIRLIYQAGLLRILKNNNPEIGLKLITRSISLLERGFRGTLAWSFWWTAQAALEAIIDQNYEITGCRKVLLGRIDQVMRQMIKGGLQIFTAQAANEAQKEILYLVAISSGDSKTLKMVKDCYKFQTETSEVTLKAERRLLAGPNIDAYESLSKAFKVEIKLVKSALDLAAKGTLTDEGFAEAGLRLGVLVNVLRVIQQEPLAKKVEAQRAKIAHLESNDGNEKVVALAHLADALLQVELACDKFVTGVVTEDDSIVGAGHFAEAKIVLFGEIQTGLAMTKRAMTLFMDSRDKLHLTNIKSALDGVRGAWIFLGYNKASAVIAAAIQYFENKVLDNDADFDEARLEVLADALTSIEYFAETLSHSDSAGDDVLNLAIKSIGQLGFKI
jgi:hypothetical protein